MKSFLAGVLLIWLALALSALLMLRRTTFPQVTDPKIKDSAPEDILGFGFAFEWVPLTVVEMLLLAGAYRVGGKQCRVFAFIRTCGLSRGQRRGMDEYETLARRVLG